MALDAPAIVIYVVAVASHEACYSFKTGLPMPQEYLPGKCNIGSRGRATRLTTGAALVGASVLLTLTVLSRADLRLARMMLVIPLYGGLLSALEGSMSFCVFQASRGTYDFSEKLGSPFARSETRRIVEVEGWRRKDRRKAIGMHVEAAIGAIVIASLLALLY